jgi:uncharacterized membrane protein YjgN (DUF898 family)
MNQWHYATDGQKHGPISFPEFAQLVQQGAIGDDTLVWCDGMPGWLPFAQVPNAPRPTTTEGAGATSAPAAFEFTGEWTEYFKIWIVNVLLTVVTLGIYAAWAKVRKRRYFYGNTRLLGHTFEYLADPKKILIGNLIVGGVFVLYSLAGAVSPLIQLPVMLALAVVFPWFMVRALTFNARNSAWRGLRFGFEGRYGGAAKAFLLSPMLMPFTLGLIYPLIVQRQKAFTVGNHAYGRTGFRFEGKTGDIFIIYLKALLFFLPVMFAYGIMIATVVATAATSAQQGTTPDAQMQLAVTPVSSVATSGIMFLVGIPLAFAGIYFLRARMFNYVWNRTALGPHHFAATMRARDLFGLQFVNALVTMFTLGLLYPWAAVRAAKFQLGCLRLIPVGGMDEFVASSAPPVSALGESAGDLLDFDLGFGA